MHVGQSRGGSEGFTVRCGYILYFLSPDISEKRISKRDRSIEIKIIFKTFQPLQKKLDKLTHWFLLQAEFYP